VTRRIVADAGPLIALARTGYLHLLRDMLGTVEIPPAVQDELRLNSNMPGATILRVAVRKDRWIRRRALRSPHGSLGIALGAGETEAILLAAERKAVLLVDERRGRKAAKARGIAMIGTARVLLEAKQRGLIKDVAPALQALMDSGYRITRELHEQILRIANESV
jgi:predicted nucleic acid-binding protein